MGWRRLLTAKRGWLLVAGVVGLYEVLAPPGELLSEGVDVALESGWSPLVVGGVVVTALHLLNVLPAWMDPYALLARVRLPV